MTPCLNKVPGTPFRSLSHPMLQGEGLDKPSQRNQKSLYIFHEEEFSLIPGPPYSGTFLSRLFLSLEEKR